MALARSVCVPLARPAVFQANWYGAALSLPACAPSTRNSTRETWTLSDAVAATLTVPLTVAPLDGDVSCAVGAVVSLGGGGGGAVPPPFCSARMVLSSLFGPGAEDRYVDGDRTIWSIANPSSRVWTRIVCVPVVAK